MIPQFLAVLMPAAAVATAADITPSSPASKPPASVEVVRRSGCRWTTSAPRSSDGSLKALVQAFLRHGPGSGEFEAALTRAAPHRWVEK